MGSPCQIRLCAESEAQALAIARRAMADVLGIEARYSRYRDDSILAKINRVAAEAGQIDVDEETAGLLDYARTCYEESGGLFDITSGILRKAWDFKSGRLPSVEQLHALLAKVGWDKLSWQWPCLEFKVPGMELDFGGIGKEYAADRAATLCYEQGARHGLVDLGGDIKVIGPPADGTAWQVGIQHPRQRDGLMATIDLKLGAVASSGDYERHFEIDGRRYSHLLNPKTGWPAQGLAAVSVIAPQCLIAGSASTIAMLMEDDGKTWLEKLGLPHVWMDTQGRVGGTIA